MYLVQLWGRNEWVQAKLGQIYKGPGIYAIYEHMGRFEYLNSTASIEQIKEFSSEGSLC